MKIEWTPADAVDKLQAAIDVYWRQGHILARDAALLRWQYRNPSEPDRLSVLQATENGNIVGMLGLIQTDFNNCGQRLPAVWLATWFAAPNAPGGTGLTLLRESLNRGAKVVACLGFNDTARTIYRALRFTVVEAVPRWVRVVCPEALGRLLALGGDEFMKSLDILTDAASRRSQSASARILQVVDWAADKDASWDLAWGTRFAPGLVGTWRDSAYLRWRYLNHPAFQYRVQLAENSTDSSLQGLIVYHTETIRGTSECVVRIVELLGDDSARSLLVAGVVEEASSSGAAFVDCFCTLPSSGQSLKLNGFVRDDLAAAPLPMLFQPLDFRRNRVRAAYWTADAVDRPFDETKLYVTRSDGDQDRPN